MPLFCDEQGPVLRAEAGGGWFEVAMSSCLVRSVLLVQASSVVQPWALLQALPQEL